MKMNRLLYSTVLALLLCGLDSGALEAQQAVQTPVAGTKDMKTQMDQMHAQMDRCERRWSKSRRS